MAEKEAIRPAGAPAAANPLTPGIRAGSFLFVSGQTGGRVVNGERKIGEGIAEQTTNCIENIKAVLEAGGSSLAKVVKCTVFLTDMKDFAGMNAVYTQYFEAAGSDFPTRSTVEVSALANPALIVEIEAVALA